MKNVQATIKILINSEFSSDIIHFLTIIGGEGFSPSLGGSAQKWEAQTKRDLKLSPCRDRLQFASPLSQSNVKSFNLLYSWDICIN